MQKSEASAIRPFKKMCFSIAYLQAQQYVKEEKFLPTLYAWFSLILENKNKKPWIRTGSSQVCNELH